MSLRRGVAAVCLLLSLGFLAWGYGAAGYGPLAALALVPGLAGPLYRKYPTAWLTSACLACLAGLAAAGLALGAPSFLMITAATAALTAWDLANLDIAMEGSDRSRSVTRWEREHLASLAAALGLGLLLAAGALLVALQLPFVLLFALIILDLFSLDRATRYLRDRTR